MYGKHHLVLRNAFVARYEVHLWILKKRELVFMRARWGHVYYQQ